MSKSWKWVGGVALFNVVTLSWIGQSPRAFSTGITSVSGNPDTGGFNCNLCHTGGVVPTVTIEGPTTVAPSSTNTYLLRIRGGQQIAGGLDVSANAGVLTASDPGTYLSADEITHNAPRPVNGSNEVVFTFNWTAPADPGSATLYGAGNSVNLNGNTSLDRAASAQLAIAIGLASTPGETSGPTRSPLLVTDYDPLSGELRLSYDPGCETTNANIYYGNLEDVGTYGWTAEVCAIGTGGIYDFDPGSGSRFFVVVGTRDAEEGSYGRALFPGGSTPERPPFATNTCGQVQTLDAACSD